MDSTSIRLLLRIYTPFIHFAKFNVVKTNIDHFPNDPYLLYYLYVFLDLGYVHSSKRFCFDHIPVELNEMIFSYVLAPNCNLLFAKQFYRECFNRELFFRERDAYHDYLETEDNMIFDIRMRILNEIHKKVIRV